MALIRWLKPGELPALGGWDLWRLREVGAWGDLGRRVGARWEVVGGLALASAVPRPVIELWRDRGLGRWLGTLGVPNPDAILIEPGGDGGATLRSIDLKWSIDTAEYGQIAGERLRQLVERGGDRLGSYLPGGVVRFGDGLFATPDRPLNRLFLRSGANRRREYPIEEREVLMLPIDPADFFGPLPGWRCAVRLARLERTTPTADVDVADRYYHLGVGVWGALAARERSIFVERENPTDDDLLRVDESFETRMVARLEETIERVGARSARDIVNHLQPLQRERTALRARRRELERLPYRFGELVHDIGRSTVPALPDGPDLTLVRDIHRALTQEHAAKIRARGRALVESGMSDASALDALTLLTPELRRTARERARELLLRPGDVAPLHV